MKVKVFDFATTTWKDNPLGASIEATIQDWLAKEKPEAILHVVQTFGTCNVHSRLRSLSGRDSPDVVECLVLTIFYK